MVLHVLQHSSNAAPIKRVPFGGAPLPESGRRPSGARLDQTTSRSTGTHPRGHEADVPGYSGTSSTPAVPPGELLLIDLSEGENPLGILEQGWTEGWTSWKFVDFVRLTVILGPAESPSAATGHHWVLTDSAWDPTDVMNATAQASNGRIETVVDVAGPPHLHAEDSGTWGPPPTTAAPGYTWSTTIKVELTCSGDAEQWINDRLGVSALWTADGGRYEEKEWEALATCQNGTDSKPLSWTFPTPDPSGNRIQILVAGGASTGGNGQWRYVYEWK